MKEEEFYISESEITFSMKLVRFYFQRVGWIAPKYTAKLFWKLFTKPRKRIQSPSQLNFLATAKTTSHFSIEYNAPFTIHKFGHGKTKILLCHGWEGRTTDFKNIIQELEKNQDCQIWSIDFPGHGVSPHHVAHLPIFIDVIKSVVGIESSISVFIGHSLGAASLAMTVPELPDNFHDKKIIMLGLHPVPSEFFEQYKKVTKISEKQYMKCVTYAEAKVGKSLTHYDCNQHTEIYNRNQILLVHDTFDKIIRQDRILELEKKIQSANSFFGDHGGHFKHYKHPEAIAQIDSFIRDI